eukprot:evm.model.scf_188.5 EVM.evm.TU.scf_188.5   scf_188:43373-48243(+)
MKRLFGTKKDQAPPPSLADASGNIQNRGDTLDAKIAALDAQLLKAKDAIKRTRPGPTQDSAKKRALTILKQKRLYEGQRDQLYQQQFNIDQVQFTTESVKDTVSTVQAMKTAHKELKTAMKAKEFNIDKIESMQDGMQDLMDMQNEVNEALGRTYDVPEELDETDLMDELDALEADLALESDLQPAEAVPSYMQANQAPLPEAPAAMPSAPEVSAQPVDEYGLPIPQRN